MFPSVRRAPHGWSLSGAPGATLGAMPASPAPWTKDHRAGFMSRVSTKCRPAAQNRFATSSATSLGATSLGNYITGWIPRNCAAKMDKYPFRKKQTSPDGGVEGVVLAFVGRLMTTKPCLPGKKRDKKSIPVGKGGSTLILQGVFRSTKPRPRLCSSSVCPHQHQHRCDLCDMWLLIFYWM